MKNVNQTKFSKDYIFSKGVSMDIKYMKRLKTNRVNENKFNLPVQHKLVNSFLKRYNTLLYNMFKHKYMRKSVERSFIFKISKKFLLKVTNKIFQSIVSLVTVIIYIILTYFPNDLREITDPNELRMILTIYKIDLALGVIILINYFYDLINSKNKFRHLFKIRIFVDFFSFFSDLMNIFFLNFSVNMSFIRISRLSRIIRVLKIIKLFKSKKNKNVMTQLRNNLSSKIIMSILTILTYLFFFTGFLLFLYQLFPNYFDIHNTGNDIYCKNESIIINDIELNRSYFRYHFQCNDTLFVTYQKLTFDSAFYFIIVTMTTLGYGDIYPNSRFSKIYVAAILIFLIINMSLHSRAISDSLEMMMLKQTPYKSKDNGPHVILTGFINKNNLIKFLAEFNHYSHSSINNTYKSNIKIVIVQPSHPDPEIESVVSDQIDNSIYYFIGNISDDITQKLCEFENALACFMLSNISTNDNDKILLHDCKSISKLYNLKIFLALNKASSMDMDWCDWTHAFSIQQIKNNIIVKSSFISGFSTFMMNLFCTSSGMYMKNYNERPWMVEYLHGTNQKIFIVKLEDNKFIDLEFENLVKGIYNISDITLIGIKKKIFYKDSSDIHYFEYLINPINYRIGHDDDLIVIAEVNNINRIIKNLNQNFNNEMNKIESKIDIKMFMKIEKSESIVCEEKKNFFNLKKDFIFKIGKELLVSKYLFNHILIFCKFESLCDFVPNFFEHFKNEYLFYISPSGLFYKDNEIEKNNKKLSILRKKYPLIIKIECDYDSLEELNQLNLDDSQHSFILSFSDTTVDQYDSGVMNLIKIINVNFLKCRYTVELMNELNISIANYREYNLNERKSENDFKNNKSIKKLPNEFKFSESHIFLSTSLDYLLPFSFHNSGLIEVLGKFLGIDKSNHFDINENSLIITVRYIGNSPIKYEDIFRYFINLNSPMICLGVYRTNIDTNNLGNHDPYFVTNPKKKFVLYQNDIILILGETKELISEQYINLEFKDEIPYNGNKLGSNKIVKHNNSSSNLKDSPLKNDIEEFLNDLKVNVKKILKIDENVIIKKPLNVKRIMSS